MALLSPAEARPASRDERSTTPTELAEARHVKFRSFDGTVLDGTLLLPKLPAGVKTPVMLQLEPYFGQIVPHHDDPNLWNDRDFLLHYMRLVREGYAVALFSMRGTGNSEGCLDLLGSREHRDAVALIEWLAEQPWSNGRVGMASLSYGTAAVLGAAAQNPEPLKTILVAGIVSDYYTFWATPQGSLSSLSGAYMAGLYGAVTNAPPACGGGVITKTPSCVSPGSMPRTLLDHLPVIDDRLCQEYRDKVILGFEDQVAPVRHQEFYDERRLIDDFSNIRAAVLLYQGLQDLHIFQQDLAWGALKHAPKWAFTGQWGHTWPNHPNNPPMAFIGDWHDRIQPWLDHWLKGIGPRPAQLGRVDYQDGSGTWRSTTAWPPRERREEVLYLSRGRAGALPEKAAASFRSVPTPATAAAAPLCSEADGAGGLLFRTEPLAKPTLIAGNAFAYLRITSDQPSGQVGVQLYELTKDFGCTSGEPHGYRLLTDGAADLRFHQGNFTARPFPVNTVRHVRVDFPTLAEQLPAGHRLAVVISYPVVTAKSDPRNGTPDAPVITISGNGGRRSSHVVVPVVEGTFGGSRPTLRYPARPFSP